MSKTWKILLIDDSELALKMEMRILSSAGFDVRATTSLDEFQALLQGWLPDLILSDVDMPDMTGPQLCSRLKNYYETSEIPIVLFSSRPESDLEELAAECGADGFLCKRNGFDKLADELRLVCEAVAW